MKKVQGSAYLTHGHVIEVSGSKQEVHVASEHDNLSAQKHDNEVPPEDDGADQATPEHNVRSEQVGCANELSISETPGLLSLHTTAALLGR